MSITVLLSRVGSILWLIEQQYSIAFVAHKVFWQRALDIQCAHVATADGYSHFKPRKLLTRRAPSGSSPKLNVAPTPTGRNIQS